MEKTSNKVLANWVNSVSELTNPQRVHWCDGSQKEFEGLVAVLKESRELTDLNQSSYPHCYLYRSNPNDVARTEHLTFVCTKNKDDAGPNNNWMDPQEAHRKANGILEGAMKNRTMYVIPYVMGPVNSPYARCGVEITDSAYVALNMLIMTRAGDKALERIERDGTFVKGLHTLADVNPERRYVMHFPEELAIISVGTGYGGNALLGKKCHALRIASHQAKTEGWLAEHMLILGVETPKGETFYVAGAFPSGCGKTNLAMLIPPESMKGYKIWTVGDDIAWMHLGEDGRLWAINPESGFFGIVPGTNYKTNPNAMKMITHDAIYTNVAVSKNKEPWWEGLSKEIPADLLDWQGRPFDPKNGPAAHPNSRFTVPLRNCPTYTEQCEAPQGVPISAIIFGGRRKSLTPLVTEAVSWAHGVWMGATSGSETTAAYTGKVGVTRYDPMAMKPFCGYNMGDYWTHWLSFASKSSKLPKIFRVNWFRQDHLGKFMWPGYGENLRVLEWILGRCTNNAEAKETPIGLLPTVESLNAKGLDVSRETVEKLLTIDQGEWRHEMEELDKFLESFGSRLPKALTEEHNRIKYRLMEI